MKLSEIPDHVKRLLLATCEEDWDADDLEALDTEEVRFVRYYAVGTPRVLARMELMGRPDVGRFEVDLPNPWGDVQIELDEPLPALRRPRSALADPALADCWGESEMNRRGCLSPDDIGDYYAAAFYREEMLRARYADLFRRELHFGWPVPEYDAWAKTQKLPGARR